MGDCTPTAGGQSPAGVLPPGLLQAVKQPATGLGGAVEHLAQVVRIVRKNAGEVGERVAT